VPRTITRNSGDFNRTDRIITWWARAVWSELRTAYSIPLILGTSPSRRRPASVALWRNQPRYARHSLRDTNRKNPPRAGNWIMSTLRKTLNSEFGSDMNWTSLVTWQKVHQIMVLVITSLCIIRVWIHCITFTNPLVHLLIYFISDLFKDTLTVAQTSVERQGDELMTNQDGPRSKTLRPARYLWFCQQC